MTATTCTQTHSSRATPTVQARCAQNSPVNNPPFRHWYGNPLQSTQPCAMAPHGHIEDVPKEPKKDSDDGDPDPDLDPNPDPELEFDPEPRHNDGNLIKSLFEAIKSLSKSVHKDPSELKVKIRDPNTFDSSDSNNLEVFCCSANSTSGPSPSPSKPNSRRSTTPCPS